MPASPMGLSSSDLTVPMLLELASTHPELTDIQGTRKACARAHFSQFCPFISVNPEKSKLQEPTQQNLVTSPTTVYLWRVHHYKNKLRHSWVIYITSLPKFRNCSRKERRRRIVRARGWEYWRETVSSGHEGLLDLSSQQPQLPTQNQVSQSSSMERKGFKKPRS